MKMKLLFMVMEEKHIQNITGLFLNAASHTTASGLGRKIYKCE